ncbi:MAG: hypothetical protein JF571_09765, partial [Asticcacaulis sp.]|nr:hypothetical protein [Asticcacaulis sp.]
VMGFGGDSIDHVRKHGLDYPLIVHFHAVVFMSWLVLLTVQVLLVRRKSFDIHKRLGIFGACLAAVMAVLGPATAIVVEKVKFAKTGQAPIFLSFQLAAILSFSVLVIAAILLRRHSSAHKRLILLATIGLSAAGFARWLGGPISKLFAPGLLAFWCQIYLVTTWMMVALGIYDLVTRRRLHPAWICGFAWALGTEIASFIIIGLPAWAPISLKLIGH